MWKCGEWSMAEAVAPDDARAGAGDRRMEDAGWVRFRRGRWNETTWRKMRKYPDSFMVWGRIGLNVRPPLIP